MGIFAIGKEDGSGFMTPKELRDYVENFRQRLENGQTQGQHTDKVNEAVPKRSDRQLKKKAKVARKHEIGVSFSDRQLKKRANVVREHEISVFEERSSQDNTIERADEFEKLVRSSPNNSFVWIKYMALMLSLKDIEKARSIAERALQTINTREEGDMLNIWIAFLNLENEYGSPPEEAVSKTFEKALQYCDPKKLHLALLGIYEETGQFSLANGLMEKMTKKFRKSCKVWLRSVRILLKQGKDGFETVCIRAILHLPQRKHMKFLSQAAVLEFKCGVPDRGRARFESMLEVYPKRTHLWSVYLDEEIRHGDVDRVRALFEKATCSSLRQKNTKLLKKYLKFEKLLGDEERIEFVKRKLERAENSPV